MKVKILGKYVGKTGIESLLVTTESKESANSLAIKAREAGASDEQILKFITTKDYQGVVDILFSLTVRASHLNGLESLEY